MKRRTAALLAIGAVGVLVTASTAWWWMYASRHRPLHAAAMPPRRVPTRGDRLLAALVNAVDANMRSLELGRWYVRRLQAAVSRLPFVDCDTVARSIDYEAIARDIPRANAVTRREVARLLRQLVEDAASRCPERALNSAVFIKVLGEYDTDAFDRRQGLLWGMPGYTVSSSLPLPPA